MPGYIDDPSQDIPMSAEEVREWWERIRQDRRSRKQRSDKWRALFAGYMPPNGTDPTDINSNVHFRNVHLKAAEIFAQLPDLILEPLEPLAGLPDPMMPGQPASQEQIVSVKKAVLKKMLGRDHANAELMCDEALFDVFATSGVAATKICYESDVQYPPDDAPTEPTQQPGAILGLNAPPVQAPQPVVVNERWRWYRFDAEKLGIPSDFHSTNYDEAPYLFMEFVEPLTDQTRKKYNLPPYFQPNVARDEMVMSRDVEQVQATPGKKSLLHGIEVFLYACYFDSTVAHTQVMRRLVLVEGLKDRPALYRASPYQTLQPDGKLSPDSMIGNPIHPITLRVASSMAWIPSDAAFTDPLVRLENTMMSQDIKMRDANIPRFFHSDKITNAVDKLKNMDAGQGCAIPDEIMARGADRLIAEIPHLEHAQADASMRQHNQRALAETLGISSNQAGAANDTTRSATEVATIQANISVRLKKEQNQFMARFLSGVRKFDALLQRYMTDQGYITIVGQQGQRQLVPYTQAHLVGRYAYDYHPDSQLVSDQDASIRRYTNFVNFLAKSGFLNMHEIVRIGSNLFGYDPARTIQDPKPPPPPPPEQPSISIAIKAPDLMIPEVRVLLAQRGIQLDPVPSPELMMAAQREAQSPQPPMHGGAAEKVDLVDKHTNRHTGEAVGAPPMAGERPPGMPPEQRVQ